MLASFPKKKKEKKKSNIYGATRLTGSVSVRLTCVRAQVPFEGGVAGEGALAVAADVAVHAGVDLHVLLQGLLGLEAFCAQ